MNRFRGLSEADADAGAAEAAVEAQASSTSRSTPKATERDQSPEEASEPVVEFDWDLESSETSSPRAAVQSGVLVIPVGGGDTAQMAVDLAFACIITHLVYQN